MEVINLENSLKFVTDHQKLLELYNMAHSQSLPIAHSRQFAQTLGWFNGFPLVTAAESFLTCFTHEAPWQLCRCLTFRSHTRNSTRQAGTCSQDRSNSSWKVLNWDPQATAELEKAASFSLPEEQQRAPQPRAPKQRNSVTEWLRFRPLHLVQPPAQSRVTSNRLLGNLSHSSRVWSTSKSRETPQVPVPAGEPRAGSALHWLQAVVGTEAGDLPSALHSVPGQPRVLLNCLCCKRTALGRA